jgi:nicotinamidase-related amidase
MHPNLVDGAQAFVLAVDLQESYRKALFEWERTVERARVLLSAARILELPILYTEQHPKGLGPTASELSVALEGAARFEKRTLSALGAPGLADALSALGRRQAIVCGIETHACINQTAHDLLARGYTVHLPADALSSRRPFEHEQAYAKLVRAGALATSVEQVLLECLRSADHPAFKPVQALLK